MAKNKYNLQELRTEEVQEIMDKMPGWTIRFGNYLVLSIIILMLLSSYLIKYPEVIEANITLTTDPPPEKIFSKSGGRLKALLVNNKSYVPAGTIIAVIENAANFEDVLQLKSYIEKNTTGSNFDFKKFENAQLGELEDDFTEFHNCSVSKYINDTYKPITVSSQSLSVENLEISNRIAILQEEKKITENELELAKKELSRYEQLFQKGIISEQDNNSRKVTYLQTEKAYQNIRNSLSLLVSSLNDNNKSKHGNYISNIEANSTLFLKKSQAYSKLKKAITDWELNNTLECKTDGIVTFIKVWRKNQYIEPGENSFTIIPQNTNGYIGKMDVPTYNAGKVKTGQRVIIHLSNYPSHEFGVLKGVISNISLIPDKSGNINVDVAIPKTLETSYKKKIVFQQEMTGRVKIITEDLRLIDRILFTVRDVFNE